MKEQAQIDRSWLSTVTNNSRYEQSRSTLMHIGFATAIGLFTGVGVYIFKFLINFFRQLFFFDIYKIISPWINWGIFLIPTLGGLCVGVIRHFLINKERHHGVAGIMEATALAGGRLHYKRIPIKTLVSAISIGSGASVGPEDPSVQIGSNIGSMVGQKFMLSDDMTRALVAAGAAAGIAAAFNAPIAGVFFALEVILGQIGTSSMGPRSSHCAFSSAVITQAISGSQPPHFIVPKYAFNKRPQELPSLLSG